MHILRLYASIFWAIIQNVYSFFFFVKFLGGFINRYRVLDGDNYDDNGSYIGEKEPRYHFYIPHVSVMRMYDTHECVYPNKSHINSERG